MDTKKNKRLVSLDTLRGFDMFFIMGGGALFIALATLFPIPFFKAIASQMHHVAWNGLTFEDMIFPLFLFIAGISFPYSLDKQRSMQMSQGAIYRKIIRRGLTLALLGCIYNGLLFFDFAHLRYGSVLGRIGLAWMLAALIYLNTQWRTRIIIVAGILLGYWLILALIPSPTGNGDPFSMEGCLVGYIDNLIMPGQLYIKGIHDPEGLFSTIPAIATALLGMFTGEWIKFNRKGFSETHKTLILAITGVALIVIGIIWNQFFPINKNLWSSSFVCVVGGISMLLFALFYYIIDVKNYRRWTFFFRVIGLNSITIYLAQRFINFKFIDKEVFGGLAQLVPESASPLVMAIGYILLCWGLLYFLYKQKIFLKV